MKKLFLLLLTILSLLVNAQVTISGSVADAETGLPLEGASVFAQNTTTGTITNKEGNFHLSLKNGGYELVITYTGYQTERLNIDASENKVLTIQLKKQDKSLEEVVIKSSSEVPDGWEKYGQFFLDHFIGKTAFAGQCSLQNPQALKFYYFKRTDRIKVLATEPLQIANSALGYHLNYQLDSFVFFNKTGLNSYRGSCLYRAMEGDTAQQAVWSVNRKTAYNGSRLHFLRSYYDSTLKENGFTVDLLSSTDARKFSRLKNPYDTAYYYYNDSTNDVELWFPAKISVTYHKAVPEPAYLEQMKFPKDVRVQLSYVDLLDGIIILPNGFFYEQKNWINEGYWSWKNIADQLPVDYELDL